MSPKVDQLVDAISKLPPDQREDVIQRILNTDRDRQTTHEIDQAIQQRMQRIDAGEAEWVDGYEVLDRLRDARAARQ